MRRALLALALIAAPAQAATYGPPAPVEYVAPPKGTEWLTQEMIDTAEDRRRDDTSSAWRKFWIGQGLAAADIGLTCAILAKGGREANPIYGKNASCGRIAAIRGGFSALQYLLARRAIRDDPHRAGKTMNITIAIQGVPVIWNAIQLVK